jgi:hypothetical protein
MNSLKHNLPCLETLMYIYLNVTWKMAQMKIYICWPKRNINLVAQMEYCNFQKLSQMQYARAIQAQWAEPLV